MAVVRVKRHLSEEPIDSLLLTCKRRKTEEEHLSSIFKFATTVFNQDESVSKHIKEFRASHLKTGYKAPKITNITNITEKLRVENKLFSQNNRLKVVNCFRSLNEPYCTDETDGVSKSEQNLTIVEIDSIQLDPTEASSGIEDPEGSSEKYAYDIYYAPDCILDENMLNNPISCHNLDELTIEDVCDDVYTNEEDSDDSNDENNWRNDYPDEDPDSINEEDMHLACSMKDMNLSDRNSLSSSDTDDDFSIFQITDYETRLKKAGIVIDDLDESEGEFYYERSHDYNYEYQDESD